jgi:uncharacterized membrane protein
MFIQRKIPGGFETRVISIVIFTALMFTFLHSEVGLFDFDNHNHGVHDYCDIVKNTNSHSNILREELPKLELNKDNYIHSSETFETRVSQTSFVITNQHLKAKPFPDLYLVNNTFLI